MPTVSEFVLEIQKQYKDQTFTVSGDIEEYYAIPDSYALFNLTDGTTSLRIYMSGNLLKNSEHTLDNGLRAEVTGYFSIFDGLIQIRATRTRILGKSEIKALERVRIDPSRKKRPLPPYIKNIAVITSENGKAKGDFQNNIQFVHTQIFPCVMSGPKCPDFIKQQVECINQAVEAFDCLIIIRGGDDYKNLEVYNHPIVVHAILDSKLPVLTSIGHDADQFDCDKASDNPEKLSTPTAVANFINKHNSFYIAKLKNQPEPKSVWPGIKAISLKIPYTRVFILLFILYTIFHKLIK
ncbi:exodeoxyribonuclease VII large subunit [Anaerospora hongkongensis]|uniref:exodeoxyribonuclease VII large subunit n=1 Tax=Anaerospora hongkongensis TaxID=244830 RepID=UPI002FDAC021